MRKRILALLATVLALSAGQAQTLFTYGPHKVSRQEFLRAFNKNNSGPRDAAALKEYLDLYTKFRLKVQGAYDMKLDTLPGQRADLENFSNQVISHYLTHDSTLLALVYEAMDHSRHDRRLSHIYIPFSAADSAAVARQAHAAVAALDGGRSFESVALEYSKDPAVQQNKGQLGWVSSFVLPYELEKLAWKTPLGKHSRAWKSDKAWHILHPAEEREATGNIQLAQILLELPANAGTREAARVQQLADSLYQALAGGADFGALALQFSADNATYNNQGVMQPFSPGTYDPIFEAQAVALTEAAPLSKPFRTSQGWHILRFIRRYPKPTDSSSQEAIAAMKTLVQNDARHQLVTQAMISLARQRTGITDPSTPDEVVMQVYSSDLEKYDSAYALQLQEFREGNLLFEAMQRKVWDKSAADEKGLQQFYRANSRRYLWKESITAVIFTSPDSAALQAFHKAVTAAPSQWKTQLQAANGSISYDSTRMERSQLPLPPGNPEAGVITTPVFRPDDQQHLFLYILQTHPAGAVRSFEEARGQVLNDYQEKLENDWIASLRKKYPVKLNDAVWKSIQP